MTDIVTIGDATLYHGDCLEILPTLPKVDAVVTDPPYGIGFDYISYEDSADNLKRLVNGFVPVCREIASRVVITPGNTNLFMYPQCDWIGSWTWDTTTACGALGWSQWQPFLFYGKDVSKGTKNWNGALKTDRIHFSGGAANIEKESGGVAHPCPKPIEFVKKLCGRFSVHGDIILDPFMGSGTTGVACANLGRKFIGIEIERKYFDIACERIEAAYSQGRLFA